MQKSFNRKLKEIAKIPAFQLIKCIKNEEKFLQPSSQQEMWENVNLLMNFYNRGGCLSKNFTEKILKKATKLIKNEPNVLYLADPIYIAGDIHGQFYDLVEHLEKMNIYSLIVHNNQKPILKRKKVLFLGDYVDRGKFSIEVVILLLVLKIYLPKTFYLLRGNHECREVTQIYNFRRQCKNFQHKGQSKYKQQQVYELFIDFFSVLPLAAVVNGTYFCVHGGLSEELNSVEDIDRVNRFREIPRKGLMCDLVWADPVSDETGKISQDKQSEFNRSRNCSILFGNSMLRRFFDKNDFMCVIRAHEVQQEGYGFLNWGGKWKFPNIITLFSAPNYCGGVNKGAMALIEVVFAIMKKNQIQIFTITKKLEPFVFPNFINAFDVSIPFMIAHLTEIFFRLLSPQGESMDQKKETNSQDSYEIVYGKELKSPISKRRSKTKNKNEDERIEQKIVEKQEYLFEVYSEMKHYINRNISFKWKLEDSVSRKMKANKDQILF